MTSKNVQQRTDDRFKSNMERLLRFDTIRMSKLFELVQSGVQMLFMAFIVGQVIDMVFPPVDDTTSDVSLLFQLVLHISLNIIAGYYLRKINFAIPFIFHLSDDYVADMKGEEVLGSMLVLTLILYKVQPNFQAKISMIIKRYSFKK